MASKIVCPRCGGFSANFVQGVCRPCYMRDYHQRRSASAITQCPRCGAASANFVQGVCRACYMRKQGVSKTPTLIGESEGQRLCVECKAPGVYARSLCLNCYMRDRHRQRRPLCVECAEPGIYARGLCHKCYVLERQRRHRQRFCVECGEPGIYARSLCQNCYLRDRRRLHRMKLRACGVCGVSFQSVRRDALYCSAACRQKAHRTGKAQLFLIAPNVGEQGAQQSAIEAQDAPLAACVEVQAHAVAASDRRVGKIDSTTARAAERGRTDAALSALDGQRKARQVLAGRRRVATTLVDRPLDRAALGAKGRQSEAAAAPVHRLAELIGAETDSESAIRWLLALMMLCCDPPAKARTAAAPARKRSHSDAALTKILGDVLQVAD